MRLCIDTIFDGIEKCLGSKRDPNIVYKKEAKDFDPMFGTEPTEDYFRVTYATEKIGADKVPEKSNTVEEPKSGRCNCCSSKTKVRDEEREIVESARGMPKMAIENEEGSKPKPAPSGGASGGKYAVTAPITGKGKHAVTVTRSRLDADIGVVDL